MFDKIIDRVQYFVLNSKLKKLQQREPQVSSWKSARTVGIVCLIDEEDNWKLVQRVADDFQNNGAKVYVVGIFYGNVKPLWFVETLSATLCMDKHLRFMQIPKNHHVDEFIEKSLDLLINFSLTDKFAPFYVAVLSKAKFKIALDTEENRKYFDMLLRIEDANMNDYQKQILHYLKEINS